MTVVQMVFCTGVKPRSKTVLPPPPNPPLVCLLPNGKLTIAQGYAWDGVTAFPDLPSLMRASLAHDALYQLMQKDARGRRALDRRWRKQADRLFRDVSIADGTSRWLAGSLYLGLRWLGWLAI